MPRPKVLLLPGGITPVAVSYADAVRLVDGEVDVLAKDLEVYVGAAPPRDYSVEFETDAVERAVDGAGFGVFHVVGFSGGGAVALAYAAEHAERVASLALIEPAWIGRTGEGAEEGAYRKMTERLLDASDDSFMQGFMSGEMRRGVAPPPPAPVPPPWMATRPAGLRAMMRAFAERDLDLQRFRGFAGPVYYALGGLSAERYGEMAARLAEVFPDFTLEVYEERSHLDPPHRGEPDRFVEALRALWAKAQRKVR